MDTNTITLTLIGKQLLAKLNINGSVFGQVYKSREEALHVYFTEADHLREHGTLAKDSCILD